MKKILIFMLSFVLWSNFAFAKSYYGHGDLKLSEGLVDYYIKYLKGNRNRSPLAFLVAPIGDGRNYATYYFCPAGQANCTSLNRKKATNACADSARKKYNDQNIQCFIFDFRRIVKWDNGINPGKGKTSKINSKWSKEEIIAKLTELGFYGETSSSLSKTTTEKEETKKKKKKKKIAKKKTNNSNLSLSEEIKQLNELYKDGALTEEEFKAAKAKLLNPSDGSLIQDYNQATDLGIDFMCYNMCKDTTKGMSISQLDSFCKNQCPLN